MSSPRRASSRACTTTRTRTRALKIAPLVVAATALGLAPQLSSPVAAETRPMTFPHEGGARFSNDFGAARSGGRRHQGNDLLSPKLVKVLAVRDGTITRARVGGGLAGNQLILTDDEGWSYWYLHLNNDTPGTDDGRNPAEWVFAPGITQGTRVTEGQHIGYVGDSGNAENAGSHTHFEVHRPGGGVVNPYDSLVAASSGRRQLLEQPAPKVAPRPPVTRAVAANPKGGHYVLSGDGVVKAFDGAPDLGSPRFPGDLARGMAVTPDGQGYLVLDAYGGVHKYGSARTGELGRLGNPYWPGLDIARSVAVSPSGRGYAILDGFGAVHSAGDAPQPSGLPYHPGWDIVRSIAITPSGEGLYTLDGWGGVHASGDAVDDTPGVWWPRWDIARTVVASPRGYTVLDGLGGLHPVGDAPRPKGGGLAVDGGDWRALSRVGDTYLVVRSDGVVDSR